MKRLLLGLLLTACAPVTVSKPGATEADFRRDNYECRYQAESLAQGVPYHARGLADSMRRTGLRLTTYEDCMAARGWERD